MIDEISNLILEHLRHIRSRVDTIALDLDDVKHRVSALEQTNGQVLSLIGAVNMCIDRVEEWLSRIEGRLELVQA